MLSFRDLETELASKYSFATNAGTCSVYVIVAQEWEV